MRRFRMCVACQAEYDDPLDRRFHAQPNACPECGPRLSHPLEEAVAALRGGHIVALKGLGGYQLACDARSEETVAWLRRRKRRPSKPFAVMLLDPERYCLVSDAEREALRSPVRPIVLLRYRGGLAPSVAPGLRELGAMLPSTPLHYLLLRDFGAPLVMTSGNRSEEPICCDDAEARERLAGVADLFLAHDRPIAARYDDSVVRVAAGATRVIRRARGLAPEPLPFQPCLPLVATGAHLKAAFTVVRGGRAFVGPHVGDLDDLLTVEAFQEQLGRYLRLFSVTPMVVACDQHPDYASTRAAERLAAGTAADGVRLVRVQHHHGHVASVIAEHGLAGEVTGVAMDGVGLGSDGTVWGGEVLVCRGPSFRRAAHLAPVPLPGGDRCAREGWRMAAAFGFGESPPEVDPQRYELVRQLARSGQAPLTTSTGRLFDAVASLLGVCQKSTYEGEAAMRLEAVADPEVTEAIEVELEESGRLVAVLAARRGDEPASRLAAVLHNSLTAAVVRACRRAGPRQVALAGGCFQNRRLLESCAHSLQEAGFAVYANHRVPANDGGLSLGQAWVAACTG
jgi:hydrogenase maturation protein HypF